MREASIYSLLVDLEAIVHSSETSKETCSFEAHVEHSWQDVMEISSKPIMDSVIDSKI